MAYNGNYEQDMARYQGIVSIGPDGRIVGNNYVPIPAESAIPRVVVNDAVPPGQMTMMTNTASGPVSSGVIQIENYTVPLSKTTHSVDFAYYEQRLTRQVREGLFPSRFPARQADSDQRAELIRMRDHIQQMLVEMIQISESSQSQKIMYDMLRAESQNIEQRLRDLDLQDQNTVLRNQWREQQRAEQLEVLRRQYERMLAQELRNESAGSPEPEPAKPQIVIPEDRPARRMRANRKEEAA